MDGWMDGWVGGWMDGWMDGRVDGSIDPIAVRALPSLAALPHGAGERLHNCWGSVPQGESGLYAAQSLCQLVLLNTLWHKYAYPHFTAEEAQIGYGFCLTKPG